MLSVLIYGAGEAGQMVAREIRERGKKRIRVEGFLDDDPFKSGMNIQGIPVLGGLDRLSGIIGDRNISQVIIAMPSVDKEVIRTVVRACVARRVKLLIVPSTREIIDGSVRLHQIRDIDPGDLLLREPVRIDTGRIGRMVEGRRILVTGAAGSIGSALVRKLLAYRPEMVLALDLNENGLFHLQRDLEEHGELAAGSLVPLVSDIKMKPLLADVFERFGPELVFHAAAYKHVPLMQHNVKVIFLNNLVGTCNLLDLCLEYRVDKLVGISTDKAVHPVSIMGKTKRVCELLIKEYAARGLAAGTVRFGNVLGSNGSVVTVFREQIRSGGPVTVTSPRMVRYFMTVDEAVSLVLQASTMNSGGDVHVLDMGDPIRIQDLAESMILLSGLTPGRDISISYTGVREGEKLSEELFHRSAVLGSSPFEGITVELVPDAGHTAQAVREAVRELDFMSEEETESVIDAALEAAFGNLSTARDGAPVGARSGRPESRTKSIDNRASSVSLDI